MKVTITQSGLYMVDGKEILDLTAGQTIELENSVSLVEALDPEKEEAETLKEVPCAKCGREFQVCQLVAHGPGTRMILDAGGAQVGYLILGDETDDETETVCWACGLEVVK